MMPDTNPDTIPTIPGLIVATILWAIVIIQTWKANRP